MWKLRLAAGAVGVLVVAGFLIGLGRFAATALLRWWIP